MKSSMITFLIVTNLIIFMYFFNTYAQENWVKKTIIPCLVSSKTEVLDDEDYIYSLKCTKLDPTTKLPVKVTEKIVTPSTYQQAKPEKELLFIEKSGTFLTKFIKIIYYIFFIIYCLYLLYLMDK